MTLYIIRSDEGTWYEDMVGQVIENAYLGYTGHYHLFDNIFGNVNREIPIKMLLIYKEDAIVI